MKSWEYSRNIIAFFKCYPEIFSQTFSFYSTIISNDLATFQIFHSSYNNPEIKDDPYEITEEVIQLLYHFKESAIKVDLVTNIDYLKSARHQAIYEEYIAPLLQALTENANISDFTESGIDVFSLQGLFRSEEAKIIPDMVNTVIYV